MADGVHLHLDDYPATLELLSSLLADKHADVAAIGYAATEHGATVDWDRLEQSWLSSTERAVVHLARGCAILERVGGCPERLADVVVDVVTSVVSGDREPASPLQNVTNVHDLWWNDLSARLDRCSVYGGDSLRRSTGNAFTPGELLAATGRDLPGWERDATLVAVARLTDAGFVVRSVLSPSELSDGESLTGSPVVGGAEIVVDDVAVTVVTYIDAAAEIYTRVSQASWPADLTE